MIFKSKKNNILKDIGADIYEYYKEYTMISQNLYIQNLNLIRSLNLPDGVVVECGVWRGGMIAGIAKLLGNERIYYLFDSFEGLPDAKIIDGQAALDWQNDKENPGYYDNCTADAKFAKEVMKDVADKYYLIKGLFEDVLPKFEIKDKIALLRLDADWYESTYTCLKYLYPHVLENGLIIIDDYFAWDGCSKAVHDYLSNTKSNSRIRTEGDLCYIIKNEKGRQY